MYKDFNLKNNEYLNKNNNTIDYFFKDNSLKIEKPNIKNNIKLQQDNNEEYKFENVVKNKNQIDDKKKKILNNINIQKSLIYSKRTPNYKQNYFSYDNGNNRDDSNYNQSKLNNYNNLEKEDKIFGYEDKFEKKIKIKRRNLIYDKNQTKSSDYINNYENDTLIGNRNLNNKNRNIKENIIELKKEFFEKKIKNNNKEINDKNNIPKTKYQNYIVNGISNYNNNYQNIFQNDEKKNDIFVEKNNNLYNSKKLVGLYCADEDYYNQFYYDDLYLNNNPNENNNNKKKLKYNNNIGVDYIEFLNKENNSSSSEIKSFSSKSNGL